MQPQRAATKSAMLAYLAEQTGLTRKDVQVIMTQLESVILDELSNGPGVFTIAGLVKLRVIDKPAKPERMGFDPLTKQQRLFKAQPAKRVVKCYPLKALKDLVK